jgi:ketosteroid isomerase-like protein
MTREQLQALGEQIVALNNANDHAALMALYGPRVASVEAMGMPGMEDGIVRGKKAIQGKWEWWMSNNEVHSSKASGPFIHGDDRIGVIFEIDVTDKASKKRVQMKELAIYTARDGKVIREEFFY